MQKLLYKKYTQYVITYEHRIFFSHQPLETYNINKYVRIIVLNRNKCRAAMSGQ